MQPTGLQALTVTMYRVDGVRPDNTPEEDKIVDVSQGDWDGEHGQTDGRTELCPLKTVTLEDNYLILCRQPSFIIPVSCQPCLTCPRFLLLSAFIVYWTLLLLKRVSICINSSIWMLYSFLCTSVAKQTSCVWQTKRVRSNYKSFSRLSWFFCPRRLGPS